MATRKDIEIDSRLLETVLPANGNGTYEPGQRPVRAPEANEMLERPPSWLMRWGIIAVTGVFALLFGIAAMIRYPDTIEGSALVTTSPMPIRLKAMNTGRIVQLFLPDNTVVGKGQPIAEIENNTGYEHINKLAGMTDSVDIYLQQGNMAGLHNMLVNPEHALGEAQPLYNTLLQHISACLLQHGAHIYTRRTGNLQQQIQHYRSVALISGSEMKLIDEELKQADERFAAIETLYRDKVISRMEYYEEAAKMRQRKLALEAQRKNRIQNNITLNEQSKQLLDAQYDKAEKERALYLAIEEAGRNLQNYIQSWTRQYLIRTPYHGRLHYLRPYQQNEAVTAGEELFALTPAQYHYAAFVSLPANGLGKVQPGQEVHLQLHKYPYQEFGYLRGSVTGISELPMGTPKTEQEITYRVTVALPDSLLTSYQKTIPFTPEMTATARIITADRSLLQRLIAAMAAWKR